MLEDSASPMVEPQTAMYSHRNQPGRVSKASCPSGGEGVIFANQVEGWALIERKPLDGDYTSQASEDA